MSKTSVAAFSDSPARLCIQVISATLNPVDWKMAESGLFIPKTPIVLGCDAAGIVEAVGQNVRSCAPGDAVATFTPPGVEGCGAFAEFCLGKADQMIKKPPHVDFDDAAALPIAVGTALIGLHSSLKLTRLPHHVRPREWGRE